MHRLHLLFKLHYNIASQGTNLIATKTTQVSLLYSTAAFIVLRFLSISASMPSCHFFISFPSVGVLQMKRIYGGSDWMSPTYESQLKDLDSIWGILLL